MQVPLLIRAPWAAAASAGKHTQTYTELIDLYRTVASLAGIPRSALQKDVDGDDVSALLADPTQQLKDEAYAQYSRCPGKRFWPKVTTGEPDWWYNNCEAVPAKNITSMGYSVRTSAWRFTEWYAWDGARCVARFDAAPIGTELYSHAGQKPYPLDFNAWENVNVADDPANADAVKGLRAKLFARFNTGADLGCPPPLHKGQSFAALEDGPDIVNLPVLT